MPSAAVRSGRSGTTAKVEAIHGPAGRQLYNYPSLSVSDISEYKGPYSLVTVTDIHGDEHSQSVV